MLKGLFSKNDLARALLRDDLKLLLKVIRAGKDINQPLRLTSEESTARPAVEHALRLGHSQCLEKLLDAGARLPERDSDGVLLLSMAINKTTDPLGLTTLLLHAGANANAAQGEPLFSCLNISDDNLVLLLSNRLLQYGADLNSYSRNGHTLLSQLICAERTMLVGAFISEGAELPKQLDQLQCSAEIKQFARRKATDIAIQKQLLGF